jgi:hypothetical protein
MKEPAIHTVRHIIRTVIRTVLSESLYKGKTSTSTPIEPKNKDFTGIAHGAEVTILKGKDGRLYVFMHSNYGDGDFKPYSEYEITYAGRDEDGYTVWEDDPYEDVHIDEHVVARYVNDHYPTHLPAGEGMQGWTEGELTSIDQEVASEISTLWPDDGQLVKSMSPKPAITGFPEMNGMKLKSFQLEGSGEPFAWAITDDKNRTLARLNVQGSLYVLPIAKRFNDMGFEKNPANAVRFVFLKLAAKMPEP